MSQAFELPIFPLPNVVFFPFTILLLHVFEPRYKKMVTDALQAEQRIGMILLRPGWQAHYFENPEVCPTGGMGVIEEHVQREDGEYDILLKGQSRFRVLGFVQDHPYRVARIRLLRERSPQPDQEAQVSSQLLRLLEKLDHYNFPDTLDLEKAAHMDFRTLVNSICSSLQISVSDKQWLLEKGDVGARATTLLGLLETKLNQVRAVYRFAHLKPEDPHVN